MKTVEISRKLSNGFLVAVICPKAPADYNLWMGAVDKFDQKQNAYTSGRHSKKSWYRIFYFFFDGALVINAFIQHSANNDLTCGFVLFWDTNSSTDRHSGTTLVMGHSERTSKGERMARRWLYSKKSGSWRVATIHTKSGHKAKVQVVLNQRK